ncbi:MAG: hypothetical protein N2045_13490 [Fimbriimonadales bacterium]|jgi:hypothetical protein|nr:hypothetical protein [Fimbriimonadales bacterium]
MPISLLRWLAWMLALWLMGAPIAVVAGCLYACDLQKTLCCWSEPTSGSFATPDPDNCADCGICHPRTPPRGDLPHKLTPLITLAATLVAKPEICPPVAHLILLKADAPLKLPLYKYTPETPRAPPGASFC